VRALKSAVLAAGIDARVCSSGCFDLCSAGAAIAVMPDGVFIKRVGLGDISAVVDALRSSEPIRTNGPLQEKLASITDFDAEPR
jgi:(2Fe-2S) ferredoxin